MEKDHLHLLAKNLTDTTDTDSYDVTLLTPSRVSVQILGIQIDRWTLERVPASPSLSVATDWDSDRAYYSDESAHSNPDMDRIIGEDQKARQKADISQAEWSTIHNADKDHRQAVRELLAQNALHNSKDFGHAAFVFQHGDTSDDFLLAHTLAMVAVARGDAGALWIATATLDRYLDSIKQPQIYGTQFHFTKDIPWTQEPYNRNVISDGLRHQLGVPSQAEQQKQLEQYKITNQH
jgi:hypothetical protein